jgi:hypothetical protein
MTMLQPSPALLCKLGSIAVHAQELLSPGGHEFDRAALGTLFSDAEVRAWLADMDAAAMVPKMRNAGVGVTDGNTNAGKTPMTERAGR